MLLMDFLNNLGNKSKPIAGVGVIGKILREWLLARSKAERNKCK